MRIVKFLTLFVLILNGQNAFCHHYGEHKLIGDIAMQRFIEAEKASAFLKDYFPLIAKEPHLYVFPALSAYNNVTYGTINGLGGDHSGDVYSLEALLKIDSYLQNVIQLHEQYIAQGLSGAPDNLLAKMDKKYAILALKNMAHFYEYGKGWREHFIKFDAKDIELVIYRSSSKAAFKSLNNTNAISMYVILHTAALYLSKQAGHYARQNLTSIAKEKLYHAFLFNAYADHFLEDAFSSGHLLVNRSIAKSLVNNKTLHDFYSQHGTMVINSKGESWKAYGDNMFNKQGNIAAITYINNLTFDSLHADDKRIIAAVQHSISELKEAFEESLSSGGVTLPIFSTNDKAAFALKKYKALQLIPLPYGTKLKPILGTSINDTLLKNNSKPYLRNFIRNRSANSFVIGITDGIVGNPQNSFQGFEYRLNIGLLYSKFQLNSDLSKKGISDIWIGYTASFSRGIIGAYELQNSADLYKMGIRSNFDFWVSNKSFIGLFMYSEVGILDNQDRGTPVFSPQLGIQLGSLLKVNYYNVPTIWRLPLQLILPLKFKINATYANEYLPIYSRSVELDITF